MRICNHSFSYSFEKLGEYPQVQIKRRIAVTNDINRGEIPMGWAICKVNLYLHQARPTNFLEQLMLKHSNPLNFIMTVGALTSFMYGLWVHDWCLILGSAGFHFSWP